MPVFCATTVFITDCKRHFMFRKLIEHHPTSHPASGTYELLMNLKSTDCLLSPNKEMYSLPQLRKTSLFFLLVLLAITSVIFFNTLAEQTFVTSSE